ncbi:MAG: aminotransferase class IV family protein [Opitutaceae bacterium]|nr:aminotransferase class IV family protein [Opitutaceae bacterium]
MTPYIQANTNGRLHSAAEPSIAPLDRGFLYGDAIYEVWRTHLGVIFTWGEHWARLGRSAASLHMNLPWTAEEMLAEVRRTTAAYRAVTSFAGELYIRLQVSRGGGAIGLDIALADRPTFVLLVQPCPENSAAVVRDGLRLAVATGLRRNPIESLDPAWKTGNYLNNLLGLREARARGADEVLMLNLRGEITEASTSNIAFVRGEEIITPPVGAGILEGITRAVVLKIIAPSAGVTVREAAIRPEDLGAMSECFVLSTTKNIAPVGAIDGRNFKVGPGTVTARLQAAFDAHVRAAAAARAELRV